MGDKTFKRIRMVFTLVNLTVGWHLLYEGVAKILTPGWSCAGYLINAHGPLAGLFHAMAQMPLLLRVCDILNMAGLTIAGLCILTGVLTRTGAVAGVAMIALYYLANPPLAATSVGYASEGHYLWVNKNAVEIMVLILVAVVPSDWYYGLGKLVPQRFRNLFHRVEVPAEMNHTPSGPGVGRREWVKNLISLPVLGGFVFAVAKNHGWRSFEESGHEKALVDAVTSPTVKLSDPVDLTQLKKPIPKGKLGGHEIGRIICGGNLINGFAHSRDLIYVSRLLKAYFTDKKVMDTFWLCERCGINATAVSIRPERPEPVKILNTYWNNGGKIKWIAPIYPTEKDFKNHVDFVTGNGACAVMIQGNIADHWARDEKWELMAEVVAYIKSKGVPAGVAQHELATVKGAEAHGVGADFYMKTLHSRHYWSWNPDQKKDKLVIDNYSADNYWERTPEETIAYMASLNKPWIAFKTLAAGAIRPKEGFRYAFENGADFACVGMFDYQVVEDANILTGILDDPKFARKRAWIV